MVNYERGIEVVVGTYIINDKNNVLLFRSPKWDGKWTICGGHIEPGETIEEATNREMFEETGLKVKLVDTLSVSEKFAHPPEFKRDAHFIFIDSIANVVPEDENIENSINLDGKELTDYHWFHIDEALQLTDIVDSCHNGLVKLKEYLTKQQNCCIITGVEMKKD